MRWDSKIVFIAVRALLASIGVLRTIAVIRLLSLEDYALIGIVESTRNLVGTLLGFGVGDSISREGAIAKDSTHLTSLVIASIISATILNIVTGAGLYLLAGYSTVFYNDARVSPLLLIAILVAVTERYWLLLLSVIRVHRGHQWFIFYSVIYGVLAAATTIGLTWKYGLTGYFHSQWVIGGILIVIVGLQIAMDLYKSVSKNFVLDILTAAKTLWSVSIFMYMFKGSSVIWRRGPFLFGAQFIDAQAVGIISISLDLAGKLQLLQQSLSPLIVPKLSKIFTDSKERFLHSAKSELLQVFSITISACFIGCGLWYFAGGYLVGYDRWQKIGDIFYLAIAVEFTLAISNIFNMCVLLPSRSLSGLALPTILFRVLTIPLMFFLDPVVQDDVKLVFYVMSVTGIMVFIAYAIKSFFTLYEINKSI